MAKELIGALSTFFIMLPFWLLNRRIFRVENRLRFAFFFLVVNVIQLGALFLTAYSLFYVGQRTLTGMLVVFSIYLVLFLVTWATSKKPFRMSQVLSTEEEDFLFHEEKVQEGENEVILEEDRATLEVTAGDFTRSRKQDVNVTLEDIFRDN